MSPVNFGPSDNKNPRSVQWGQVPESFWLTKALLFDFDWIVKDAQNKDYSKTDYPEETSQAALKFCFRTLRSYEIRLCLTSNRKNVEVVPELARLQLAEDFDNIRCFEEVKEIKPSPEMHLLSLDMVGVKPARAVAFETSVEGVKAAKEAGIFCVGMAPLDSGADLILNSIIEAPLLRILENIDNLKRQQIAKT